MRWTREHWSEALPEARIIGAAALLENVETFFIDSRFPAPLGMFVPLRGENTDGHQYLAQALASCLGAFCSAAVFEAAPVAVPANKVLVVVPDVLEALAAFAAAHLDLFPGTLRVGVTGSNGKTTTKELLAAALEVFGPTYATAGNWNSEIGVPLTALGMDRGFAFAVFEMGINHRGEMDLLASVVRPLLSIVTNIGTAHIGMIGSQHEIALEKKKIFSRSGSVALAVLPAGDRFLPALTEGFEGTVRLFGRSQPGFRLIADQGLDGTEFEWKGTVFRLSLPGLHHIDNALAVLAAVEALGLDWRRCAPALASVGAAFGRGQVEHGPVDLLLDCYNANFDSMLSLFALIRALPKRDGRSVLVLGSMKELGAETEALHRRLGTEAARLDVDAVFFFGTEAETAYAACIEAGFPAHAVWTEDFDGLVKLVDEYVKPGDLVMLKGSRSNRLERLRDVWFKSVAVGRGEAGHVL